MKALIYMATINNPEYLGPAPTEQIAKQILVSIGINLSKADLTIFSGPSGPNTEYLLNLGLYIRYVLYFYYSVCLAMALRNMNVEDEHIFELEKFVNLLLKSENELRS
jgi:cation transport protein ChaC